MADLDDTDRRLIDLLRKDGRMPAATLARILGVSRATVQNRIDRLMSRGVLVGFTARLRSDVETVPVRALTMLEARATDNRPVIAAIRRIPEVARIYSTNGRWDVVVEINAGDLATLDRVLTEVRSIRGVTHTETNILLTEL